MSFDDNSLSIADLDYRSFFIPTNACGTSKERPRLVESEYAHVQDVEQQKECCTPGPNPETKTVRRSMLTDSFCEEKKQDSEHFQDLLAFADDSNPAIFTVSSVDDLDDDTTSCGTDDRSWRYRQQQQQHQQQQPVENVVRVVHGKRLREIARELAAVTAPHHHHHDPHFDSDDNSSNGSSETENASFERRWLDVSSKPSKANLTSNDDDDEEKMDIEQMMQKVGNPPKSLSHRMRLFPRVASKGAATASVIAASSRLPNTDAVTNTRSMVEQNEEGRDETKTSTDATELSPKIDQLMSKNWSFLELRARLALKKLNPSSDEGLPGVAINITPSHHTEIVVIKPPPPPPRPSLRIHHPPAFRTRDESNMDNCIANMSTLTNDGLSSVHSDMVLENVDYLSVLEVASTDRDLSTIASITSDDAREVFCKTRSSESVCSSINDEASGSHISSSYTNNNSIELEIQLGTSDALPPSMERTTTTSEVEESAPVNDSSKARSLCRRMLCWCQNPVEVCFLLLIAGAAATLIILLLMLVQRK